MKLSNHTLIILSLIAPRLMVEAQEEEPLGMVKMCLFYGNDGVSGHARADPILHQSCPSDHVHTFYGPQNFHPSTTYNDLRATKPQHSTTPWIENQSLYWHPSIYRVTQNYSGAKTYTRVSNLETSPYYRWNPTTTPETVEFPPGFRMIAYSNQTGAEMGGETGGNLLVECCDLNGEEEDCKSTTVGNPLIFPTTTCDFLGIALAMPTCWDESKGIGTNDPFNHVTYTVDGHVGGDCPPGYNKRIPQVQLFLRINNYKGGTYQLSDGSDVFHVDFMNGWEVGKLAQIIRDCPPTGDPGYNPECDCTQFLTRNNNVKGRVCDEDVKRYIIDEETNVVTTDLPRGTCQGEQLIAKSWDVDPPFNCFVGGDGDGGGGDGDGDGDGDNDGGEDGDGDGTDDGDCADSELKFLFKKKNKKIIWKDCEWVDDHSKREKFCKKTHIKSHCPVVCEDDSFCTKDSMARLFKTDDNDNERLKCKKVKNNQDLCSIEGVCGTCRSACAGWDDCNDV